MSTHVFVISEWLAKKNKEDTLFELFKKLAKITLEKEKGCIKYNVTRQISHPATRGESKYNILLTQEYVNVEAFDNHCKSQHVADFGKNISIVEDWRCRIFSEE